MSENEQLGDTQLQDEQQPAPAPKDFAGVRDVQTGENTPMQKVLPPVSPIIRDLTEEEKEIGGFLTIFLGNSKKSQIAIRELITKWLSVQGIRSLHEDGKAPLTALNKAEEEWVSYVEANHPGKTPKEMEVYASELYGFASEIQDEIKIRSQVLDEDDITNVNNRGGNLVTGDIVGKKPSRSIKGFKASQIMRRATLRSDNTYLTFDVLLRDSFTLVTFMRPNRTEMGSLINDIRREVKGYVRQVNNNTAVLAAVAARKVIWKFIVERITACSISDITDFSDLARYIRYTDFDRLVIGLLESFTTKGVNMNLRCLSEKCTWSAFKLVDVSHMVHHRGKMETVEEKAIYANLLNGTKKYTIEETEAFIKSASKGVESNHVYNEDESLYLTIDSPSVAEAFETFEYFVGRINSQLADVRAKVTNPQEYEAQVAMVFNDLGATEFIHWVSGFVSKATEGTDEEDIVILRSETDSFEFNEGLMDVLTDNRFLNRGLSKFILNKTPYMTRNIIGVRNYECPHCRKDSGALADPNNVLERKMGYTPIDPVMTFFTLTHLMMVSQSIESSQARSEALSE